MFRVIVTEADRLMTDVNDTLCPLPRANDLLATMSSIRTAVGDLRTYSLSGGQRTDSSASDPSFQ